jgi:MFS family permease
MLGSLLAAIPITFVGMFQDRYGLRQMMVVCLVLLGGACCLISLASGWFSLWLSFFLLRCLGPGSVALMSASTLSYWFHKRLGTVEGIRALGMACAMALVPMGNLWLLNELGWRRSYFALGILLWVVVLPVILVLYRNRPEDVGQTIDGEKLPEADEVTTQEVTLYRSHRLKEALRTVSFWLILTGTCLFAMIQTGVFFSLMSITSDRGLLESDAVLMNTAYALCLAMAHLFGGMLSDRLPARVLMSLSLGLFAVGLGLFSSGESVAMLVAAGVILGLSQGTYFSTANPTWARYFGRDHLGRIRGFVMTAMVASSSLGPLLIGLCKDLTGGYGLVLAAFALTPLPVSALMFLAKPPLRKQVFEQELATAGVSN